MLPIKRLSAAFLLFYLLVTIIGASVVWNSRYQNQLLEHESELDRFSSHISSRLDKYAHLPRLLARDRKLIEALNNASNPAQIDLTNRYLAQINQTIGASDTYLLDAKANTIAASNWELDLTFVGRNFSWRPYYQQAMLEQNSQYFALGSTSGQRGYYYSSPVIYAAEIIGVVVVKMDLSAIEDNWRSDTSYFVATDANDIIFMSSKKDWLFKSLYPIDSDTLSEIRQSQQYLDRPILTLGLVGDLALPHDELINPKMGWLKGDFIVSSKQLADIPLVIRVFTPKITIFWSSFAFVILNSMMFAIAYLLLLLYQNRQLKQRQFEQLQLEAKQKLEFLVMERTAKLQVEIRERIKTEEQLRQTQAELIQAAKLAVLGQISASISHELNNPLAAIRSFADNGRRFLKAGKTERADDNLSRISSLTDRMASISKQLKSFARKSDADERVVVQLYPLILSTKELLQAQMKSHGVDFRMIDIEQSITLCVNPIQLEQVLINILTNAIQEISQQTEKRIELKVETSEQHATIVVDDNGKGIEQTQLEMLFEPFFTTKTNGLGLGLSISQQIIQSMGGDIAVSSSHLGGARFAITLPLVSESDLTRPPSVVSRDENNNNEE